MPKPTENIIIDMLFQAHKAMQKQMEFVKKTFTKIFTLLKPVTDALVYIQKKLSDLKAFISSSILSAVKKNIKFFQKLVKNVPNKIKQVFKFLADFHKALKTGIKDKILAAAKRAFGAMRKIITEVLSVIKDLILAIKPIEQLITIIKKAETMISFVISDISDVLKQLYQLNPVRVLAKRTEKDLRSMLKSLDSAQKATDALKKAA